MTGPETTVAPPSQILHSSFDAKRPVRTGAAPAKSGRTPPEATCEGTGRTSGGRASRARKHQGLYAKYGLGYGIPRSFLRIGRTGPFSFAKPGERALY